MKIDLSKITENTIIEYATLHNNIVDRFESGPCIITTNGTIINCKNEQMHSQYALQVVLSTLNDNEREYYYNNDTEEDELEDEAIQYFEDIIGIITVNGGRTWAESRCKIVIGLQPTSTQYEKLLDFIDAAAIDFKHNYVMIFCGKHRNTVEQEFSLDEYTSEDIIHKIKKYFAFGRLEEKLKHKTYIVEGTWSLPWSSFNMKSMKQEQAPQSKIDVNLQILKGIFAKPITPLNAGTSIDAVYGDDDLSDDLYNAYVNRPEDYDARIIVYHHLKDMIADYKENPKIFTVPADEKTTDAVIESINKILDDYFNSL